MHEDYVEAASASPDGALVATGSSSGEVIVWQVKPFRALGELKARGGERDRITGLATSKSQILIGHHAGGDVEIWDLATRKHTATVKAFTGRVAAIDVVADGSRWAALGADRGQARPGTSSHDDEIPPYTTYRVRVFEGKKRIAEFDTGSNKAWAIALSKDGKRVAVGAEDTLIVGDASSGKVVQRTRHAGECGFVGFGPEGVCVVSSASGACYRDGKAALDLASRAPTRTAAMTSTHVYAGTYEQLEVRERGKRALVHHIKGTPSAVARVGDEVWVFVEEYCHRIKGGTAAGRSYQVVDDD